MTDFDMLHVICIDFLDLFTKHLKKLNFEKILACQMSVLDRQEK